MQDQQRGYWISVADEDSARQAVKMAGLPVLALGLINALLTLVLFVNPMEVGSVLVLQVGLSLVFFAIAFRMRAGHASWAPLALLLMALLFLSNLSALASILLAGKWFISMLAMILGLAFPALFAVLALNGYWGWRWLKRKNHLRSF